MDIDIISNGFINGISETALVGSSVLSWDAVDEAVDDDVCRLCPRQCDFDSAISFISVYAENCIDDLASIAS